MYKQSAYMYGKDLNKSLNCSRWNTQTRYTSQKKYVHFSRLIELFSMITLLDSVHDQVVYNRPEKVVSFE